MKLFNKLIYCLKSKKIYKDSYTTTSNKDYPNIGYDNHKIWILTKLFNDNTFNIDYNDKFLYFIRVRISVQNFTHIIKTFIRNNQINMFL